MKYFTPNYFYMQVKYTRKTKNFTPNNKTVHKIYFFSPNQNDFTQYKIFPPYWKFFSTKLIVLLGFRNK